MSNFVAADYRIEEIERAVAQAIVVEKHYLHRKAPCSLAFGLISNETDEIVGVIMYGTPSSSTLRRGVCGEEWANDVCELNRLWIDDSVGRNAESYLIGNTVKRAPKPIVISFADTSEGHTGIVYQATNWIYTGLSAKRTDWKVKGLDVHSQTLGDKYTAAEIREKYGDRFYLAPRPRKHRYVFFACDKRKKKALLKSLRYAPQPYPKAAA